ncbi:TPA: hypothetical protein OUZ96_000097 [Legionella pneumophila]|nr:hypothetical protein [Legionella pneumophila]
MNMIFNPKFELNHYLPDTSLFSFSTYLTAMAILILAYTITEPLYRFRLAVSFVPFKFTFWLMAAIGLATLLIDLGTVNQWTLFSFIGNHIIWQGVFGALFLIMILTWIWTAFITPPIFSRTNYKKFSNLVYHVILRGDEHQLSVIAYELRNSMDAIVKSARSVDQKISTKEVNKNRIEAVGPYAQEFLLMMGNRKLCRHIVASSTVTAMCLFHAIKKYKKYDLPVGQFSRNILVEGLINKDSILYHEDSAYYSGIIGYQKPFSRTIYGDYEMVEALTLNQNSLFDINYEVTESWDSKQLEAYCNCVLLTIESYINSDSFPRKSMAIAQAINKVQESCRDLYKLNNSPEDCFNDMTSRLRVAVRFIETIINLFDETPVFSGRSYRRADNFYEQIAEFMFEIIKHAAEIKSPPSKCWSIHFISIWHTFFCNFYQTEAWKIIRHKLCRLIYKKVYQMNEFPDHQSAKVLGFCLNIIGLEEQKGKSYSSLHRLLLRWVKNNYLNLISEQPLLAESCLIGDLRIDKKNHCLIKTWGSWMEDPQQQFMYY